MMAMPLSAVGTSSTAQTVLRARRLRRCRGLLAGCRMTRGGAGRRGGGLLVFRVGSVVLERPFLAFRCPHSPTTRVFRNGLPRWGLFGGGSNGTRHRRAQGTRRLARGPGGAGREGCGGGVRRAVDGRQAARRRRTFPHPYRRRRGAGGGVGRRGRKRKRAWGEQGTVGFMRSRVPSRLLLPHLL